MMEVEGHSVGPIPGGSTMLKRLAAVALTTATLTVGWLAAAAPAQALDTSWGCGGHCRPSR